jgi:Rsm1-like
MHNIHLPEDFDLDATISYLPKNFFATSPAGTDTSTVSGSDNINRVAFVMAVFGWTAQPESKLRNGAAICEACFRTLGLWLFKSKEVNEAGEVLRPATMNYLDPIEEHREYCPWRNAKSQSGGSTTTKSSQVLELAGWQIVLRVLNSDYRLRQASNMEKEKVQASPEDPASRPGTAFTMDIEDEHAKSIREEKDKERWARLRRVKSLFEIKSLKKLHRNSATLEGKGKGVS